MTGLKIVFDLFRTKLIREISFVYIIVDFEVEMVIYVYESLVFLCSRIGAAIFLGMEFAKAIFLNMIVG